MLDLLETILIYEFPQLSRKEIVKMLHLPDTDLKQTRFYREVFDEGRDEGRKAGRKAAEVDLPVRQPTRRIGPIGAAQHARLGDLQSTQRGELAEALLDFAEAADLDAWLKAQPTPPAAHRGHRGRRERPGPAVGATGVGDSASLWHVPAGPALFTEDHHAHLQND